MHLAGHHHGDAGNTDDHDEKHDRGRHLGCLPLASDQVAVHEPLADRGRDQRAHLLDGVGLVDIVAAGQLPDIERRIVSEPMRARSTSDQSADFDPPSGASTYRVAKRVLDRIGDPFMWSGTTCAKRRPPYLSSGVSCN